MYQTKKQQSLDLIKKKEMKIQEIDRILLEEVNPKLQGIETDKKNFDEFQTLEKKLEERTRLKSAFEFFNLNAMIEDENGVADGIDKAIATFGKRITEFKAELERIKDKLKVLMDA